ncbi:hypothetical protein C0995_000516 [Termitomyces sp. Mi166|nr:hypothetical protein C0995_000516 [Termitomyces sp. Mi166\
MNRSAFENEGNTCFPTFLTPSPKDTEEQLENRAQNAPLLRYVDSMRTHGHRAARIDPLDLIHREEVAALNPQRYGLADDSKKYDVNGILWTKPVNAPRGGSVHEWWTLAEITRHLRNVYVGRIAYEYMHSPSKTERLWFSHLLESESLPSSGSKEAPITIPDANTKRRIHELLARSEVLDNFLQLKFPNLKRYGLEGGESMLPALDSLFSSASHGGIQHIILGEPVNPQSIPYSPPPQLTGMPHRGRLNLLTDLLKLPAVALFSKIKGGSEIPEDLGAEGDVLSHLVASPVLDYGAPNPVKVSLLPNPSHLEAVNPIALGKTRAKQYALLKTSPADCELGDRVMCVQLHGDASFAGQGVVMEGLGLMGARIGYTTPASGARSSLYCSDVGKMINAPVLHVNGDYPEDVVRAMDIAFRYRKHFRKPLMYEKISARQSVPRMYEEKLKSEEILDDHAIASIRTAYKSHLESELARVPSYEPDASVLLRDQWAGMVWPNSNSNDNSREAVPVFDPETGVREQTLREVGRASVCVPEGFVVHPKLERHVKNRMRSLESGVGIDWATAEALAFGTLMLEGCDVRISGQDVGRGTFSQRHAMLVDQRTEGVCVPLNEALGTEAKLELANSSLSEMAVLGFEYGASWERPNLLPIWEAQFGDFFNGAQVIIDTYVVSAEAKWLKQSGIVMLLPHGLDGAGPEHSSCRIERMLQLSDDPYVPTPDGKPTNVNVHMVYPTTPAQYFHLLRRQIKRNFRKPLIVAGPKALLRLSAASSSLSDMSEGTCFQSVLDDPLIADPTQVKRIVLLSGKIYYDLVKHRETRNLADTVAFVRLEELSPFPFKQLADTLRRYTQGRAGDVEIVYLQEEPRNQGPYTHVMSRIHAVFEAIGYKGVLGYRGRKESALPAPGIGRLYGVQQKAVVEAAFEGFSESPTAVGSELGRVASQLGTATAQKRLLVLTLFCPSTKRNISLEISANPGLQVAAESGSTTGTELAQQAWSVKSLALQNELNSEEEGILWKYAHNLNCAPVTGMDFVERPTLLLGLDDGPHLPLPMLKIEVVIFWSFSAQKKKDSTILSFLPENLNFHQRMLKKDSIKLLSLPENLNFLHRTSINVDLQLLLPGNTTVMAFGGKVVNQISEKIIDGTFEEFPEKKLKLSYSQASNLEIFIKQAVKGQINKLTEDEQLGGAPVSLQGTSATTEYPTPIPTPSLN